MARRLRRIPISRAPKGGTLKPTSLMPKMRKPSAPKVGGFGGGGFGGGISAPAGPPSAPFGKGGKMAMPKYKSGGKETIKPAKKGQKPITFNKGGLHASTGTPAGQPIPAKKAKAARSGSMGVKAERQELFRENVLTGRKKK